MRSDKGQDVLSRNGRRIRARDYEKIKISWAYRIGSQVVREIDGEVCGEIGGRFVAADVMDFRGNGEVYEGLWEGAHCQVFRGHDGKEVDCGEVQELDGVAEQGSDAEGLCCGRRHGAGKLDKLPPTKLLVQGASMLPSNSAIQ
ncbi:predicted protein [Uncinocarpus reesii 1704]|uniref:Uncharacterized protein n=1 Tax=Uncinocarpus reesii (strain UAMH 1704) TaxID=336963 RepID=C4JTK1_UNCRE|nr:uncharacterized protein UREG_05790 [Uncinocarpus reesii 1704]EEP80948.1 predicted protein [Uncinocarpus reesii 1704]